MPILKREENIYNGLTNAVHQPRIDIGREQIGHGLYGGSPQSLLPARTLSHLHVVAIVQEVHEQGEISENTIDYNHHEFICEFKKPQKVASRIVIIQSFQIKNY